MDTTTLAFLKREVKFKVFIEMRCGNCDVVFGVQPDFPYIKRSELTEISVLSQFIANPIVCNKCGYEQIFPEELIGLANQYKR
ncbi:MAG: hypothetical protein M3367_03110 [Acidobacteriota bacterium]|nr:hypothetical protein [Acidobacteriota bacterium]